MTSRPSQHAAKWLRHGIVSRAAVEASLRRMAEIVNRQNAADPFYKPMMGDQDASIAFAAASARIFKGEERPQVKPNCCSTLSA